jgi:hypothetical protein
MLNGHPLPLPPALAILLDQLASDLISPSVVGRVGGTHLASRRGLRTPRDCGRTPGASWACRPSRVLRSLERWFDNGGR